MEFNPAKDAIYLIEGQGSWGIHFLPLVVEAFLCLTPQHFQNAHKYNFKKNLAYRSMWTQSTLEAE